MARKCSSCGNNGHNSRTCSGHGGRVSEHAAGGAGVRLFGVQLHVGPSSPLKKCFGMECLSSAAPPAYFAAALAASSSSPSVSPASSLVSVEENADKVNNGYLSDGLMGRAQERKKGEFVVHNPEFLFFFSKLLLVRGLMLLLFQNSQHRSRCLHHLFASEYQ